MSNSIQKKTKAFLKEYKLRKVTLETLRGAIRKQGYTIVEFNNVVNNVNVSALIDALGLEEYCKRSKGFTYADSQKRLLFLHEDLTDKEKLMVLAHEEGHIYCNHLTSSSILGREVVEEHEAAEFAHYLLYQSPMQKMTGGIQRHMGVCIAAVTVVLLLIVGGFFGYRAYCQNTYYGEYYVTPTGFRYHSKDCGYVKGKNSAKRLTKEQYESGAYKPCDVCLPGGS